MQEKIKQLSPFLYEQIHNQYRDAASILEGLTLKRTSSFRVNLLKVDTDKVIKDLTAYGINCTPVKWCDYAFTFECEEALIRETDCYKNGEIYLQSLSSMLPPIVLDPEPREDILDMAAAPGGKTAMIAAITGGLANITACERHPIRAEKLRYNLERQGVKNTTVIIKDARQLEDFFAFDKLLLDAPCSGSGTLYFDESTTKTNFSEALVKKTVATQTALLNKAMRLVKKGGTIVYSTCSILRQENEEIVRKCLRNGFCIEPIVVENAKDIPILPTTIDGTLCVAPTKEYEGFFIAKIKRV